MANIDEFIRHWLGRLLDYDAGQKRSELVETVSRYLECGRNYDRTAHALNVHRSTLKYRLQRIREVSGHDLGDPDVCFNLQLATRALATLGPSASTVTYRRSNRHDLRGHGMRRAT